MKAPFLLRTLQTSPYTAIELFILPQFAIAQVISKSHVILIVSDQYRGDTMDFAHATYYSPDNDWSALTDGKIKYIRRFHTETEELFALSQAPHELKNGETYRKHKQQLNEHRQAMINHLSERSKKFVKDGKLQVSKQTIFYSPLFPDKSPVGRYRN